jgi:hypothetical protein
MSTTGEGKGKRGKIGALKSQRVKNACRARRKFPAQCCSHTQIWPQELPGPEFSRKNCQPELAGAEYVFFISLFIFRQQVCELKSDGEKE